MLPLTEPEADVRTIADLPFHVLGRIPKALLVGRVRGGEIQGISNKELFERIRDLSLGFVAMGIAPGDRVAIVSESRPEWLICDLAVLCAGAVTVPIYPTLSAAQVRYILEDSGAKIAVVSTKLQLDKVQEVRHLLPALEAVVLIDDAVGAKASVLGLEGVARRGHSVMTGQWGAGKEFKDRARMVQVSDLATIIYTSGTTGEPKGVMLTHGNLASNLLAGAKALEISQEDVSLSYLPLSHGLERMVSYIYLFVGVTFIFAESFDTLGRDITLVRPTLMTGVPRVYEKLQAKITEKALSAGGTTATLFKWATGVGTAHAHAMLNGRSAGFLTELQYKVAERFAFTRIRAGMGGRLRFFVSGSAPLAPSVAEFFFGVGLPIIEGYGLTETSPILTVNPPEAPRAGTVGKAIAGVELKIAEDGEILARGPNVMSGYYNKSQATGDAIRDGWFHTGDIGIVDDDGYLRITDRKKDLLVTSGGKKIAPQPIEAVLKRSPLIAEAVILGDKRKYAAALLVPDFNALERRLKALGHPPGTRDELVARTETVALYDEIVDALNRDLAQFERIKKFALLPREFSEATGELTPTMKVKRKVVEEKWKAQIEQLYADRN